MKRLFVFLVCFICVSYAHTADSIVAQRTQERILKELIEIKSIQDSTYKQRMRAFETRKTTADTSPSEYSVLFDIKGNTDKDNYRDGWNFYGWTAFFLSLTSLIVAIITLYAQRDTEKHTKNAPISAQRGKLADLPRHFYRNLVCTGAIIFNYLHSTNGQNSNRKSYPSESNLLKLQTLPDDVFLPIDIDENSYKEIHELKLLFRNYNMEVMVASNHLSKQQLTDESLVQDFNNLLFKPFFLTKRAFKYQKILSPKESNQNINAIKTIINEHFTKLMEPTNFSVLLRPSNNDYLKQLISSNFSYFNDVLDKKDAIRRSMTSMKDSNEIYDFTKILISKNEFIVSRKDSKLQKFINEMNPDKVAFLTWFDKNYKDKIDDAQATLTAEHLYDSIKPYLDYINRETWEFHTLLYYMLSLDIAIETERIGMINH